MPALSSTTELIDLLRHSGIYQAGAFDDALTKVPDLPEDPGRAAAVFVQRGVLTRFQARLLLNGRSKGFRLGPYVIQDQLGQGGMGTVFLAEHAALRRHVALKVLNPPKDAHDTRVATERFLREARSAAALDHPNIVRIHDIAQHGSVHYIVLEYVDGVTLEQVQQQSGAIAPSRAVEYIAQAAAGLQHADERGFVHRDIKPANLILTRDQKTLKILDMGLARSFSSEEDKLTERLDNGVVTGTVDFIAPEQSLGCTDLDIRADIYSLGATFFTLIAGKPPFQGNTMQKLAQHQMKPAPSLSDLDPTLPKGLAAVIAKMLAKKPKDRYQTPADVIAALSPWLSGSRTNLVGGAVALGDAPTERQEDSLDRGGNAAQNTVSAASAGTERRTTRRRKKHKAAPAPQKKWMIGASLAGVLLVGLAGGFFAFGGSKKPDQVAVGPNGNLSVSPPGTQPPPFTPPKGNPNPPRNQPPIAKPATPTGDLLYHADFSGLEANSRSVGVGEKVFVQQIGSQNLPVGWAINHHEPTTAADYLIADVSGARAIGLRHVRGGRTEVLCRLDVVLNAQGVNESRVFRLMYQFEGTGVANVGVKVDKDPYTKLVLEPLAPSNGSWQQAEFTFTRPVSDPVVLICNIASDPKSPGAAGGTLWVRSLDVWKTRATAAAPAPAPSVAPVNQVADGKSGSVVYQSDFSAVKPFQVTKEGTKLRAGTPEQLPKGVRAACWQPTATAEFRCESADGSQALGLTNLTEKSGQFLFELEREMDVRLTPGKTYRVTAEYMTRNGTTGGLMVQTPAAGFRNLLHIPLSSTDGTWRTVSGNFERRDDEPIRLNLESFSVGEGNTLYVRSIEVAELVKRG